MLIFLVIICLNGNPPVTVGKSIENETFYRRNGIGRPEKRSRSLNRMDTERFRYLDYKNEYGLRFEPDYKRKRSFRNQTSERFLNLFDVIRFENVPCVTGPGPISLNGTCYHQIECERLGGVPMTECANGFGVCCVFRLGCGAVGREEITYFQNPNFPKPSTERIICTVTIELTPETGQILFDFLLFELLPPIDGSCSDDQFLITGQNVNSPLPTICGINTGSHMYVDVSDSVERKLYVSILTSRPTARGFNIKITQLVAWAAPQNCLQYFTEPTGTIETFNYADESKFVEVRIPSYFNNLNYAICIKRAANSCSITYTNELDTIEHPFQLTNVDADGTSVIPPNQAGAEIFNCADDYISVNSIRLCGDKLNDASVTQDFTINSPVTDYSSGPIILPVRTNEGVVGRGFHLFYQQQDCV